MNQEPTALNKGSRLEEQLRIYFRSIGYYVVRGVKVRVDNFDVTDIDLWLYNKHSPLGRERVNVDIKNRRTPQAIERIFWARGLQVTLGLDRCIVATTDRRDAVVDFGLRHGVTVIDGNFLAKLPSFGSDQVLLHEDEFRESVIFERSKISSDMLRRLEDARSRLVTSLDYDGCNAWIGDVRILLDQALTGTVEPEAAYRSLYLVLSYLLIGLDFSLANIAFFPQAAKRDALREGLRHGSDGRMRTEAVLDLASRLVETYLVEGRGLADRMRRDLTRAADAEPVEILADYLSTTRISNNLFRLARYLEGMAYARQFVAPYELNTDGKSMLAVMLDHFGVARTHVFGENAPTQPQLNLDRELGVDEVPSELPSEPRVEAPSEEKPPTAAENPAESIE